jgi:[ribosomal protein S5]-alanine N-acetyltransferase
MVNPLNFTPFPILTTDRLVLRKLTDEDAWALFDYQSDQKNFPHVEMPIYHDISEALAFIKNKNEEINQNKHILWAIVGNQTNQIVGTISLWNFNNERQSAEFGYGLFPKYRGIGFMAEALAVTIEYGFKKLGLAFLEAYTSIANAKSIKLLQRAGFLYIGQIREGSSILGIYRLSRRKI